MNRVPHCKDCEFCKKINVVYWYLYCNKESKQICVDESIKTSPKWCPKRIK